MVQKSANRFVLGTRRTGTRSPERRQYGLSIDTQGINGLSTGDDSQSSLIKYMQASSLLWQGAVMPDWIRASSQWQFGKTMRRALFCTDSIASSKHFGRAAQTGQAKVVLPRYVFVTMVNCKDFISSSSPSFVSFNCCCYCQLTSKYGLERQHYKEKAKVIWLLYGGKCT